jgi:hypothetical protein
MLGKNQLRNTACTHAAYIESTMIAIDRKVASTNDPVQDKSLSRDDDEDLHPNPWEEPCGFVVHLFTLLAAVLYSIFIVHLYGSLTHSDVSLRDGGVSIPCWTWLIPLFLLILFFAVPIIYSLLNAVTVVSPHSGSLSILQDSYTFLPPFPSPLQRLRSYPSKLNSSDPLFQENVQLYFRRPMEWKERSFVSTTVKDSTEHPDDSETHSSIGVPSIGDVDVADINDWVSLRAIATDGRTTS